MSESVSGVDAILKGLRELPQYVITIQDREGYTYERGSAGQPMNYSGIMLEDAERFVEAAVHATVREIETWLRTGEAVAELYGVVGSRTEPAVNRLTNDEVRYGSASLSALADEVARRFGGTE